MSSKYERLPTSEFSTYPPSYRSPGPSSPERPDSPLPPYASPLSSSATLRYPLSASSYDADPDAEGQESSSDPLLRRGYPEPLPAFDSDPRFAQPTPSPYARAALLLFVVFLFWAAWAIRRDVWIKDMESRMPKEEPYDWGLPY
ncbi:hypothetical protein BDQ12DRAFT_712439 [Crucibulum laeve]|uniref:Uncharacterized protein n=1 Tax=Crucibulum laeve TaxID=68775 RepID=A0A5C3M0B1_9AGAR|nr:hypothetical protein BDQ12DRAFT_712439 [Crucibulum laeve]